MKVGLVGTGYWGMNHLRSLQALAREGVLDGVVLFDVDPARAKAAAKEAGCDTASSLRELLGNPAVEAIDVVTPTPSHFPIAREALLAGKHVLVEKPMTQRVEEARELVALAERAGRVLMPGHLFRYHPAVQALQELVQRRQLGDLRYLTAARQAFREPRPDMGVLHALAIHELDLFCWLVGRPFPDSVSCTRAGWQLPGIEEVAWVHLRFGDVVAQATESWATPWAVKERHLAAFGSRAAARIDFTDPRQIVLYEYHYEGSGPVRNEGQRVLPVPVDEPLLLELKDFLACAKGGRKPLADMHSGLRGVQMLEACERSAREGVVVPMR